MTIMLIDKENIKTYIPQREPFIYIDELVSADESGFNSRFKVQLDTVFLENGLLSESALVENIAQTCAAGFGYLGSLNGSGEARLGFIGAVSRLEVFFSAKSLDQLETRVDIVNSFENIHLIEGVAICNGVELIKCQMKIVQA
jgi:predicted hotdog family 3-hydroxylacyl-ACP dehydratase